MNFEILKLKIDLNLFDLKYSEHIVFLRLWQMPAGKAPLPAQGKGQPRVGDNWPLAPPAKSPSRVSPSPAPTAPGARKLPNGLGRFRRPGQWRMRGVPPCQAPPPPAKSRESWGLAKMAALCESFTLCGLGPSGGVGLGGGLLALEPGPDPDHVLLTDRGRTATLFKVTASLGRSPSGGAAGQPRPLRGSARLGAALLPPRPASGGGRAPLSLGAPRRSAQAAVPGLGGAAGVVPPPGWPCLRGAGARPGPAHLRSPLERVPALADAWVFLHLLIFPLHSPFQEMLPARSRRVGTAAVQQPG